ncbi:MAG TPA: glycosyltransferase [Cytophagaceae bacterium]
MLKLVQVKEGVKLADYDLYAPLASPLRELYTESTTLIPKIKGKKIWMINSTQHGGGVAEMMPRMISLFRQLGVDCDWLVATTERKGFFSFTKKIHNLIHSEGIPEIAKEEKELYEIVNKENAEVLKSFVKPGDVVIIHDPQPLAIGYFLKEDNIPVHLIWRCHIGHDKHTDQTRAAWNFLKPYAQVYSYSVFSATEYIPGFLTGKARIIHPSIDPLDHKNRDLPIYKTVGILCNSKLLTEYQPVLTPTFPDTVKRLQSDGTFQSALLPSDMGLLFKPAIIQISRWDRLKGFLELMKGFVYMKQNKNRLKISERDLRQTELCQLVLAGPDPEYVEDDPEGMEVINELKNEFLALPRELQASIAILKLPMKSRKHNELIVNVLQRVATLIVQNSIREGFGLTVTEAMWKIKAVIGTATCGIHEQLRDGIDGLLIKDPKNIEEVAVKLHYALAYPKERDVWQYNAQKRVIEQFLIFTQIRKWLSVISEINSKITTQYLHNLKSTSSS